MKTALVALLFLGLVGNEVASAPIDLVKLRDSSDEQPAFGTVEFSYLGKPPKRTDSHGDIKLPLPPHEKADPIQVCPEDKSKYGDCFRQQFPKDDGFIWLLTRSGALMLEQRAEQLAQDRQFKPAAALDAIASEFHKLTNSGKSKELFEKAINFLLRNYDLPPFSEGAISDALRKAVLRDDAVREKPAPLGPWDSLDFLYVAGETRTQALKSAGVLRHGETNVAAR